MISFVYFDIGGTIIKDFSGTNKWMELKRDIGVKPEDDTRFNEFFKTYEKKVNCGLELDNLIPLMAKEFGLNFSPNYSFLSDFVNRFEVNSAIWPIIEKIKAQCRVGLLTNMYPRMFDLIQKCGLLPPVNWDVIIDSSKAGVKRKSIDLLRKNAGLKIQTSYL